ncbi:penicillin-binding protein 2 [Actibacterium pelagium]|uniref:Peptidoglycan glycosyltransferase n=1 Tax=Actibacterium pelagium TaxID=2029103 RepID=A0A917AFT1_9RHOB|nr:penicillin-binding protein 2 [Actibacterium pelagium]GGE48185.1 peptidoglycan glycosyltransferase [Actibacterium pelagium]
MRKNARDLELGAKRLTRRSLLLGGVQAVVMGGLALRMRYMQVNQADQFRTLAEENRINVRLIPPVRGLIYDRNGQVLAENEQNYRVVVVREDAGDVEETLAKLAEIIPMDEAARARALKEIMQRSAFVPVTVADRLSWKDFSQVAVNAPSLPGVTPEVGLSRHYPVAEDMAHVVGYVGPVSDYDLSKLENPDPLLQIPRFQIGKSGVEAKLEGDLRGSAGTKRIEVNAQGRVIRELDRAPGLAGTDLQLTIDEGLQNFIKARLGEESAAAVVMDVRNGDLLGIASSPSFDPNKFVRGISSSDYGELTGNKYRPLANKTVQGLYPPGSTFKMVTALAALEAGVISPEETVWCPGHYTTAGRRFHCWRRGGHGQVNLNKSLEQSCDVYYYEVSRRVGIDKIAEMARKLGLGVKHDLPMSAVATGIAPDKAWKVENRQEDWLVGDTLNASIGQGFVLSSPLQLAVMTSRLATGRSVDPRLIKSINGKDQQETEALELDISAEGLRQVRRGMYSVSNSARGTARRSRIVHDTMIMAGKTGTSQVRNITAAERAQGVFRNEDLPWERRDHGLFVCYAPYDDPRIAVSVVVEHGGGGSTAAAPIARDIAVRAMAGDLPPLEAYPKEQRNEIKERLEALPLREPVVPKPGRSRA